MKQWRQFELLVAQIETALLEQDAEVTSLDRIPDLLTGQLREVDASIRLKVGSTPLLITIECRDQTSLQDDTWIEQLATKKAKIGANATIAVSSSGFSGPATRSAKHFGIELRTLESLSETDAKKWVETAGITMQFREWRFTDVKLVLEHAPDDIEITDDLLVDVKESFYEAPIAVRKSDGQGISLGEMGSWFVQNGQYPPIPGIRGRGAVDLSHGLYFVETKLGDFQLLGVEFEVEVSHVESNLPLKRVLEYGDLNRPIVRVSEHELKRPNGLLKVTFVHSIEQDRP